MKRQFIIGAVIFFCLSCQAEYHAYDTRVDEECAVNHRMLPAIEQQCANRDEIRFAVLSDSQRWYDELNDAVDAINARDDVDFVIHCGDLTDWSLRDEFEWQQAILTRLDVPYVVLIGNHDCLTTGELVFEKLFGSTHFAFTAGRVRFVCVNSNALEYDDEEAVPDFGFVAEELACFPQEADRTVVVMHAAPQSEQLFGWKADRMHQMACQFPNLLFCLHGHGHHYRMRDLYEDGVLYYQAPCVDKRNFLHFTIHAHGYEQKQIFY